MVCFASAYAQVVALNDRGTVLTTTEAYYIYQSHALVGGTVNNGPPKAWFAVTGAGNPIPGNAPAIGVVNYTEVKLGKRDFLSLRPLDILVDKKGERTGFATTYESWTVGITHRFSDLLSVRPEFRYEYAFSRGHGTTGLRTARPCSRSTRSSAIEGLKGGVRVSGSMRSNAALVLRNVAFLAI